MLGLSFQELFIVAIVAILLFGKNLPKISHGSTIGGLVDSRII